MSVEGVTKLKKYLDKPHHKPSAVQISTPAILSASKGGKLKLIKGGNPARIKFWCKRGVTIPDEIEWVRRNLFRKSRIHGPIHLFVWLGTCDTTKKNKQGYIELRHKETDVAVKYVIDLYRELVAEIQKVCTVTPILLQNSYYSIVRYNKTKGHPNPQIYEDQDIKLLEQIDQINIQLKEINTSLGHPTYISPLFNLDIECRHKNPKTRS